MPNPSTSSDPACAPSAELEHTQVDRRTAIGLTLFFILVIGGVPLIDTVIALSRQRADAGAISNQAPILRLITDPPALREYPLPIQARGQRAREPAREREQEIEAASPLKQWLQPRVQQWLTTTLRTGNTLVMCGSDDWLFHRPGIDFLAGRGFLAAGVSHSHQRLRDSRMAIIDFDRQCRAAGVALLVVPITDKAAIEGDHPTGGDRSTHVSTNPDSITWEHDLAAAEVQVMRVTEILRHQVEEHGAAFLRRDTHWTPAAMAAVADAIVHHPLVASAITTREWRNESATVIGMGDLVSLLRLPVDQTVFPPQQVTIDRIVNARSGAPWRSESEAPVLLLGDSFTNIYQTPTLGWGDAAGLGAHLSWRLQQAVDVIAINGGGVDATRRQLATRAHPLRGKRVVIWAFAERELATAEWLVLPMDSGKTTAAPQMNERQQRFTVRVIATSRIPDPLQSPYPYAVTTLTAIIEHSDGTDTGRRILIILPAIEGRRLLPAARLETGQRLSLMAVPWIGSVPHMAGQRRFDDAEAYDLEEWWGVSWQRLPGRAAD